MSLNLPTCHFGLFLCATFVVETNLVNIDNLFSLFYLFLFYFLLEILETLTDIDFNCGHPRALHCVNAYGYSFLLVIASDICIKLNISQLSQAAGHAHILFSHE